MSSLAETISDSQSFINYIRDNKTKSGGLSIRGLAALCQVKNQSIIDNGQFKSVALGEKLTMAGFKAEHLVKDGFSAVACWLVIEYFAYDSKATALGAKKLARLFGSIGVQTCFDSAGDKSSDWKKIRVKGKQARKLFTDVLQANGASDMDYGYSTNVAYKGLLGMDASQIKIDRHVPKGKPARDGLTETELLLIQVIEHTTAKMVADGSGIRKVNEVINQQSSLAKLLIANISF